MFKEYRLISEFTDCSMMLNNKIPYKFSDYVLKKYFIETGERQGWLNSENKIAVAAVSGGGDSVALMWLLSKFYGGHVKAVHINHGIRGDEADGDENFVKNLAASLNVELISKKINVPLEKLKGESIETAARRLRLETILELNQKFFHSQNIFLGHNKDDLAETVLFNILRGTGIRGSVGITEWSEIKGVKFYRPLLGLRREFLRDILRVRGIAWREDSTNSDTEYTRNFIRLKLLPEIEQNINSSAIEHLADFGEDMREVRERENLISLELLNKSAENQSPLTLNRKILRTFNDNEISLVIREVGRKLNLRTLSRGRCNELVNLIRKPEKFLFQWCGNMNVKSIKDKIIFEEHINEN